MRQNAASQLNLNSLGEPPYNGGMFYGNADTQSKATRVDIGEVWTIARMEIPITAQT